MYIRQRKDPGVRSQEPGYNGSSREWKAESQMAGGQKGVKSHDEDFVNANGQDGLGLKCGKQLIMMLLP